MTSGLSFSPNSQHSTTPYSEPQPEMTEEAFDLAFEEFQRAIRSAEQELALLRLKNLSVDQFSKISDTAILKRLVGQLDLPEEESTSMAKEYTDLTTQRTADLFVIEKLNTLIISFVAKAKTHLSPCHIYALNVQVQECAQSLESSKKALDEKKTQMTEITQEINRLAHQLQQTKNNKMLLKDRIAKKKLERVPLNTDIEKLTKTIRDLEKKLPSLKLQLQMDKSSNQRAFDSCADHIKSNQDRGKKLQARIFDSSKRIDEIRDIFMLHLKNDRSLQSLQQCLKALEAKIN